MIKTVYHITSFVNSSV